MERTDYCKEMTKEKRIGAEQFRERFCQDCVESVNGYIMREDGGIYRDGPNIDMISAETACIETYKMAVAWHFSKDEILRQKAQRFLDYAQRCLIRKDGYVYWPDPLPSLCAMGRWIRHALRAAEILRYDAAFCWMDTLLDSWPFQEEEHRFVERFIGGIHYPTSVNCFLNTYNMVTEGVTDSWLIAEQTGNQKLKKKARDVLCNFVLPGQRPDGLWNYCNREKLDMGILNDGEDEYNYCLYLVYILSNLLECPDARPLLETPLRRAVDTLLKRFLNPDGSIYAPVHWGCDHIYESTMFVSIVCWRLYHYCGCTIYEPIAARAIHWLVLTDMGAGRIRGKMSCIGLYWDVLFLDLLKDDFSVVGEPCTKEEALRTLDGVQKALSVLPPDENHKHFYFTNYVYNTYYGIQRKMQRMRNEKEDILEIPAEPASAQASMPWQFETTGYSGKIQMSYNEAGLNVSVECQGSMDNQPYKGASLYQGDGVLLTFRDKKGNHALVSVALQDGEPVAYLYDDAIPLKADLRLYVETQPRGRYLQDSKVTVRKEKGVIFDLKLAWADLEWKAGKGDSITGGIAIIRYTAYGCQFNQWGRTDLEDGDFSYQGIFQFI